MLSYYVIDYLIIGLVIWALGFAAGSRAKNTHPVAMFFLVTLFWPATVFGFTVACLKLIHLLARKHGLR